MYSLAFTYIKHPTVGTRLSRIHWNPPQCIGTDRVPVLHFFILQPVPGSIHRATFQFLRSRGESGQSDTVGFGAGGFEVLTGVAVSGAGRSSFASQCPAAGEFMALQAARCVRECPFTRSRATAPPHHAGTRPQAQAAGAPRPSLSARGFRRQRSLPAEGRGRCGAEGRMLAPPADGALRLEHPLGTPWK